jgi:hypothetical protein
LGSSARLAQAWVGIVQHIFIGGID